MSEETGFSHVNLNTVDPNSSNIPDDIYTFEVSDAGVKTYNDKKDGSVKEYTSFALTIVDSDKLSGRRMWASLFPGDFSAKQLRKVMDVTGIPQTGDFADWLVELKNERARFKAPVVTKKDKQNVDRQNVVFIQAQAA